MAFVLIRESPGARSGQQPHGILFNVSRLTIGSAATQRLHLPVEGVDRRHAVIAVGFGGRLRLTVPSSRGVVLNGAKVRRASLSPGDRLEIGEVAITVGRPRGKRLHVLHVGEPEPQEEEGKGHAARGERETAGPSMSQLSWAGVFLVTILFLLIPLAGVMLPPVGKVLHDVPVLPSDALWNPGPLHAAHQSIADCTSCHKQPFVQVRDVECGACHADVQHHVDARSTDTRLFAGLRCESCHREHKQPAALVQSDPRLCSDCHAHLERLKPEPAVADAADFGGAHPEFRLTVLANSGNEWHPVRLDRSQPATFVEHSHLRFPHAKHLDPKGVKSPTGERVLICQDCHKPDSSGREMQPISMTAVCSTCHSLRFDEQDPTTALPHGDLKAAIRTVREHFSRQYLERGLPDLPTEAGQHRRPGGSAVTRPGADESAMAWVEEETTRVTHELMEKRVCVECHEVAQVQGRTGAEQWRIRPVRLTSDWMPAARFNHAAHNTQKCTTCHDRAQRSQHATDILIPTIAKCRECHGGAEDSSKVASSCVMCHQFHLPHRGRMLKPAVSTSVRPD